MKDRKEVQRQVRDAERIEVGNPEGQRTEIGGIADLRSGGALGRAAAAGRLNQFKLLRAVERNGNRQRWNGLVCYRNLPYPGSSVSASVWLG